MNAKTLEAITRHGNSLLAAFPNATEKNPVALCKKLRRIENSLARSLVDYCNGDCSEEVVLKAKKSAKARIVAIFGESLKGTGFFINSDPRGYALKLDDEWVRPYNRTAELRIYTDMGGYGILAPDLNQ